LQKRSSKRFRRNENLEKNLGSAFAEAKLITFQKKQDLEMNKGSTFMEAKLKTFWKKREP
jgi:hypothetical protein